MKLIKTLILGDYQLKKQIIVRIISKIDIKNNFVIKGINLEGLRKIGDPLEIATRYYMDGVDEIILIDSVASLYKRNSLFDVVKKATEKIFVPLTLGGGIRSLKDIEYALESGADKISINSFATENPKFIKEAVFNFGSSTITVNIDAKKISEGKWEIYKNYGREKTGKDAIEWAREACKHGIGEILLTSIDRDGTLKGADIDLVKNIKKVINVPLIVSGGISKIQHIDELFFHTNNYSFVIGAALHKNYLKIKEIKNFLKKNKFQINRP